MADETARPPAGPVVTAVRALIATLEREAGQDWVTGQYDPDSVAASCARAKANVRVVVAKQLRDLTDGAGGSAVEVVPVAVLEALVQAWRDQAARARREQKVPDALGSPVEIHAWALEGCANMLTDAITWRGKG